MTTLESSTCSTTETGPCTRPSAKGAAAGSSNVLGRAVVVGGVMPPFHASGCKNGTPARADARRPISGVSLAGQMTMASRVSARRRRSDGGRDPGPPSDLLAHRCRAHVRRGEHRKAVQALRQLVRRDGSAAAWVRLGIVQARYGKFDAAVEALKQGRFLHRRAGHRRRADVVARLIERVGESRSSVAA